MSRLAPPTRPSTAALDELPLELTPEATGGEPRAQEELPLAGSAAVPVATAPGAGESRAARLGAGGLDAGVVAAATLAAWVGTRLLGIAPSGRLLPAFAVFALIFSFLYHVFPLAFWSRTPGMAFAGLVARAAGDQPPSFAQSLARWAGLVLTAATFGLAALLAPGGRTPADRLSGTELRRVR